MQHAFCPVQDSSFAANKKRQAAQVLGAADSKSVVESILELHGTGGGPNAKRRLAQKATQCNIAHRVSVFGPFIDAAFFGHQATAYVVFQHCAIRHVNIAQP
jgi:hypothetical protein